MINIKENISLAPYTTFKIGGPARFFCSVTSEEELLEALSFAKDNELSHLVLGGGSNILVSDNGFKGLVIKMDIDGIKEAEDESPKVKPPKGTLLFVGAGVQWDTLVEYAVEHSLYGVENLSAIPGTVGAAPVQNIGAYGAEVSNSIYSVRAFDMKKNDFVELTNKDCYFSYRDSIFKKEKYRYIITRVDFLLNKSGVVDITYKDVNEYFENKSKSGSQVLIGAKAIVPSLKEVRLAVIDIRWKKLPDWKVWGTAGSFFKNPIICIEHYEGLKNKYPGLPGYPEKNGAVKVSLGWILDKVCGMKGLCVGNVCIYEKQALVLVAKPGATSEEVVKIAQSIMKTVKEKTDIDIECEVDWVI